MNDMRVIKGLRRGLVTQFRAAGLEVPDVEARRLLCAVSGLSAADLIAERDRALERSLVARLEAYARRRVEGEPLDHILGVREFYGRAFEVSKDVLSPRPETEALVERGLLALKDQAAPHILDLGTGSGALLVTLLAEKLGATGVGVDISALALDTAHRNACAHKTEERCDWRRGSWCEGLTAQEKSGFNLIVSNPPYITDAAMQTLPYEVSGFDPDTALRGGGDGLTAYTAILGFVMDYLAPKAQIIFEIGYDQGETVGEMVSGAGCVDVRLYQDLSGHDRVVIGTRPEN